MYNILYTCINLKVITILYFEIKEVWRILEEVCELYISFAKFEKKR